MAEEGVPQDLIYLAVAESGFQPRAVNRRSRAGGMWQFMPYGNYGLARNAYVDERFDPEKSTRAYARYMKFIYDQLGDWYLSMAAYDHGTGNIQREVQRTGYADFWELYKRNELPRETENYVPEILAAIIIANHPKQYGFDEITLDPPVRDRYGEHQLLRRPAPGLGPCGTPVDELMRSIPACCGWSLLPTPPSTCICRRARRTSIRKTSLRSPRASAMRGAIITCPPDETLASIARSFHVSVSELAAANQLDEEASLEGVAALVIPLAPVATASHAHTSLHHAPRGYAGVHRRPVRRLPVPAPALEQPPRHHKSRPAGAFM